MSVMALGTMRFGAIILIFFVMVILNMLSSSSCSQLVKEKCEKERELTRLEDARTRALACWEEMKTPDKIEIALLRHGLAMKAPQAIQVVRMGDDGVPFKGQLSLARLRKRAGIETAKVAPTRSATNVRNSVPYRRNRSAKR